MASIFTILNLIIDLIEGIRAGDGDSAYELYVEDTEDDPVMTEMEWLESLVGIKGINGEVGDEGPVGLDGNRGPDGIKGYDGPAGNRGPDGEVGDKGPVGDQGPDGEQGPDGQVGPDGEVGDQGPGGITGERGESAEDEGVHYEFELDNRHGTGINSGDLVTIKEVNGSIKAALYEPSDGEADGVAVEVNTNTMVVALSGQVEVNANHLDNVPSSWTPLQINKDSSGDITSMSYYIRGGIPIH